jgi:hypothetical protein
MTNSSYCCMLFVVMLIVLFLFPKFHDYEKFSDNKMKLPKHTDPIRNHGTTFYDNYSQGKRLKSYGNKLKDMYEDNRSGNCMTHNDFDDELEDLKNKLKESFDDMTKISEDMREIRKVFTKFITHMLMTTNDTNQIYIMGMTPFHRNLRMFRNYLTDFFSDRSVITVNNMKDYLRYYFLHFDPQEEFLKNLDNEYYENDEKKTQDEMDKMIRESFRNAILSNYNFGLRQVFKEYKESFDEYVEKRSGIESAKASNNDSLDDKEDDLDDFRSSVKEVMGGSDDPFNIWNNGNDSYIIMSTIKSNLSSPLLKKIFEPIRGTGIFIENCEVYEDNDELEINNNTTRVVETEYEYDKMYKTFTENRDARYNSMFQ